MSKVYQHSFNIGSGLSFKPFPEIQGAEDMLAIEKRFEEFSASPFVEHTRHKGIFLSNPYFISIV